MTDKNSRLGILNLLLLIGLFLAGMDPLALAGTSPSVTPVSYNNIFQPGPEFSVSVNGQSVPVYNAYNTSTDSVVVSYWGTFRLCQFSYTGTVTVTVTYNGPDPINTFEINPQKSVTNAVRNGTQITFSMTSLANGLSQPLEIQINNNSPQDRLGTDPTTHLKAFGAATRLYILADAPEVNPPTAASASTMYFGPGNDFLPANQQTLTIDNSVTQTSLYVAPGAVLNANIVVTNRSKPFLIYGHGFVQNTLTQAQKSGQNPPPSIDALVLDAGNITVEDISLINSIEFNIVLFGSNNLVEDVKCFHTNVNSDGISFYGHGSHNSVLDTWIVNNDNQIVIGPFGVTNGPSYNLVSGCTFINTNGAGHFAFPQGSGSIGVGNVITNCDVIRASPGALICDNYSIVNSVNPILFNNLTVQSGTGDFNADHYFELQPLPQNPRTLILRNVSLPPLPSGGTPFVSISASTDWEVTLDHVTVNNSILTSDANLGVTTSTINGEGIYTTYITGNTSQPANLNANPGNGSVSLTWTASVGATSYNIYRSTTSGTGYVVIASAMSPNYTDTSAVNSTTYYYAVSAVNGGGESSKSTQVNATPLSTIPLAVTNLTATSGNKQVVLNWSASSKSTGYIVERSITLGYGYAVLTASPITGTTYIDANVESGILYYYIVIAVNGSGQSTYSNEAQPIPPAPANLTATQSNESLILNWTASPGATSYNVERSETSGTGYSTISTALSVTGTSFTDTSASPSVTYYYVVTASNAGGVSGNSNQVAAIVKPIEASDTPTMPEWSLLVLATMLLWTGSRPMWRQSD